MADARLGAALGAHQLHVRRMDRRFTLDDAALDVLAGVGLRVVPDKNRLIVEGANMIKRHTKPNPGKNIQGGIVEREASLHASNVQLICPECGAQTRVGHKILGDGRKVRICRKCEGVVDK